jgi:hypothetical protein
VSARLRLRPVLSASVIPAQTSEFLMSDRGALGDETAYLFSAKLGLEIAAP